MVRPLLLKIPYNWVAEYREIKPQLSWALLPCWLDFTDPEVSMQLLWGEGHQWLYLLMGNVCYMLSKLC